MTSNIWRAQPSLRISSYNLVKKESSSASVTVANTFFLVFFGVLKVWTGSAWIKKSLKVFLGTWQSKPLTRWDGTGWKLIDTN
jgi:hypothetical protein